MREERVYNKKKTNTKTHLFKNNDEIESIRIQHTGR
jgi:hypothetical protein